MESLDNTEEDADIGIIQHITECDKILFPETPSNEAYKTAKYDNSETRRVYINNDWKIKDSTGSTDFDELVVINTGIDWLSFISENNLF